jgi:hypothetical protein
LISHLALSLVLRRRASANTVFASSILPACALAADENADKHAHLSFHCDRTITFRGPPAGRGKAGRGLIAWNATRQNRAIAVKAWRASAVLHLF